MVTGTFADLCVADVARSIAFYRELLDLEVRVDHGWYAELGTADRTLLAFVEGDHETVPSAAGGPPRGVLVSFEVDDVVAVAARAAALQAPVVVDLEAELGQHHFMVLDPEGAVVDVIEPVPFTTADVRRLARLRRAARRPPS
jgi:catechol 2,3-dioxygenase-like lactoylglutathione lyase family enzyme